MIGQERAARATLRPPRTKHEVVHDQLASAVKEVGERLLTVRSIEDILFLHPLPGQFAALPAQFISLFVELLLFLEQLFSTRNPFFWRNYFVLLNPCAGELCSHCILLFCVCLTVLGCRPLVAA